MIRYTLKCSNEHSFDSWFQTSEAFEKLCAAGLAVCPICGDLNVEKAIMAPRVRPARSAAKKTPPSPLTTPDNEAEAALAKLKAKIEANSEYVGMEFASQARAIHDGESPNRAIYGEAKPEEAKSLIEDGVPVVPLPFTPKNKTN